MKKTILILLIWLSLSGPLLADTIKDKRRIDEEARRNLRPSETRTLITAQPSSQNLSSPEVDYFQPLLSKKYVLRGDALRPLLMLMGEEAFKQDQDAQISLLKQKGIIPVKIAAAFLPDQPLDKGLAAYMFCRALDINGGLILRLFGLSERYALQELVFAGIMTQGSVDDILSGSEFVAAFASAAHNLAEKNEASQPKKLK